jgi:hypothetical protein
MAVFVPLEHGTCLPLILQLGNSLVSESYQFHVSTYFSSSRSVLLFSSHYILSTRRVNVSKLVVVPHHVQGKFIHLKYFQFPFLVSVCTQSIHHLTSLSYVNFMSMMGDTSRPSFDESFPIDFNTSSIN